MKIGVIGSINIDLVLKLERFMRKGETVIGKDFQLHMGGKGANQATMMTSLVDSVIFCGAVGNDAYAAKVLSHFEAIGLQRDFIYRKEGNTGLALIQLVEGDNAIAVVPGVNNMFTREDIDNFFEKNDDIGVVVLQLEINFDVVEYIITKCHNNGIKVILNPAPAKDIDKNLIDKVHYLIPNETEAELIFKTNDYKSIVEDNLGKVIITLGDKGVIFWDSNENVPKIIPARKINVVDTTGAGDSFIAGFSVGLIKNMSISEAIELGIEVASLTCESMGAQGAFERIKKEIKI